MNKNNLFFIVLAVLLLSHIGCASNSTTDSMAGKSASDSSPVSNTSGFEKVIVGKGKPSEGAIKSGSAVRSEAECKEAAKLSALAQYTGGSGTVKGATMISCKETSPKYTSCECEVGFGKK